MARTVSELKPLPGGFQAEAGDAKEPSLSMNQHINEQPLIPTFSPYEGEKENLSLVLEQMSDLDF